jgi:ribosomal protein S27E
VSDTRLLERVSAEADDEFVEERRLTVRRILLPAEAFRDGACPACGATAFAYEHGDVFATCVGCGVEVKPRDLV